MSGVHGVVDSDKGSISKLLAKFRERQTTRALTYTLLHESFRDLLKSKNEAQFTKTMSQATQSFKQCSDEVREIEKDLRDVFDAQEVADLIRSVQESERRKLHATVALQSLRRVYEVENFSWQSDATVEERHLHEGEGGEPCASKVGSKLTFFNLGGEDTVMLGDANRIDGGEAGEPTEGDYYEAVGEATRILEGAIVSINETLEEIQYLQYDMDQT